MIRFLFFNGGDKTIPAPRHGLYVSRLIAVIPQGLSKREDCLRQIRLLHKRVGPNLFQQLILFNELTGFQTQPDNYLGGFGRSEITSPARVSRRSFKSSW